MIRILSIGNSFSTDATRYLWEIASAMGCEVETVNLYIGGCSLYTHVKHLRSGARAYSYERNGCHMAEEASIPETLKAGPWDFVTLQQASHYSGLPQTYHPFLEELADYIKAVAPGAKILMHQTWSYDPESTHDGFPTYNMDSAFMYQAVKAAYAEAAASIGCDLIPVGDAVEAARKDPMFTPGSGKYPMNRDGFHLSVPYGRYLAALVWCEKLLKLDVREDTYIPVTRDGAANVEALQVLRGIAHSIVNPN